MPYATKKPVRVEFMQFTSDDREHTKELERWGSPTRTYSNNGEDYEFIKAVDVNVNVEGLAEPVRITVLKVKTLEGWVVAQKGDYIIKGAEAKEFWPVRRDIFEKTYDVETEPVKRGATVDSNAVQALFAQNDATTHGRSNY